MAYSKFKDIYKEQLKGSGVLSSLGSSAMKSVAERVDPRNILFGGKESVFSLTGQKIFGKGYSATPKTAVTGKRLASESVTTPTLQTEALSQLLQSSTKQETHLKLIGKNTMNNNAMARDMNVMRQNIMKLVTMGGGKASRGADMFFKNAAQRESEYERKLNRSATGSVSPTPIQKNEKESSGVMSILGPLAGIGTMIVGAVTSALSSIPGILMNIFSAESLIKLMGIGMNALSKLGTLVTSITSPAVLALLGSAAFVAWIKSKIDEANTIQNTPEQVNARIEDGRGSKGANAASVAASTTINQGLRDIAKSGSNEDVQLYTGAKRLTDGSLVGGVKTKEELQRLIAEADAQNKKTISVGSASTELKANEERASAARLQVRKMDNVSTTPTKVTTSDEARMKAEEYLGRGINSSEWDLLLRAVYAESSRNEQEYANVMAVILNRSRNSGKSISDVLTEKNQFQAVTGTSKNPSPSPMFKQGPFGNEKTMGMLIKSTESLGGISTSLDSFTAANRAAYKEGTNTAWLDKLLASGGQQVGGTVFAENMYRPKTGTKLNSSSVASADLNRQSAAPAQSAPVVINQQAATPQTQSSAKTPVASVHNLDPWMDLFGTSILNPAGMGA
jgi:hypothetical protein